MAHPSNPPFKIFTNVAWIFDDAIGSGGNWGYVVGPSKAKAFRRRIKVEGQNLEYLEVLEGLHPNEEIIIKRYDTYNNLEEITIN